MCLALFSSLILSTFTYTLSHQYSGKFTRVLTKCSLFRHQWVIDHKRYNGLGMSFYDKVALNGAYQCSRLVNCTSNVQCTHGGYVNANCECVCPPSRKGQTCSSSRYPSGVDALESECTVFVNNPQVFTLQDIGLTEGNFLFYACDMTVKSPACMRPMIQVNTSSLDPLRSEDNPDLDKVCFIVSLDY